jgi:hypothetical protein
MIPLKANETRVTCRLTIEAPGKEAQTQDFQLSSLYFAPLPIWFDIEDDIHRWIRKVCG